VNKVKQDMAENRLTRPLGRETKGNTDKYDKYREAWTRIKKAQENKFFLEAITIEESIISDRLSSYLKSQEIYPEKPRFLSLGKLVDLWGKACPDPIHINEIENLQDAVLAWKDKRNDAVHAIVKSKPGQSEVSVSEFLEKARATAEEGVILAMAVQKWKRQASR
jgi:hypothetical protein